MPATSLSLCSEEPFVVDDETWSLVAPFLAKRSPQGPERSHADRLVYEAIVYVLRGGIPWRMLPERFPAWQTVYGRFREWSDYSVWPKLTDDLRQKLRVELGRNPEPTAGVIDSQSVPSGPCGGPTGYDAAKKIGGRKRHLVVDTEGLLLAATVTPASVQDPTAAPDVLTEAKHHAGGLIHVWGDGRYGGKLDEWAEGVLNVTVQVVSRPKNSKAFVLLPRRWVIERTFAWLGRCRRLACDWEKASWSALAFIYIAASHFMARRLAKYQRWQEAI
jgi:putative transposase